MTRQGRRQGRELAFQTLFELASRPERSIDDVLAARIETYEQEQPLPERARSFARRLIEGVLAHRDSIDERITAAAPAFPLDQMAMTDRVALELAVLELLHDYGTPVRVAINEGVELAKRYGAGNSGRFVNGVLGTIAEELGPHSGRTTPAGQADDPASDQTVAHPSRR